MPTPIAFLHPVTCDTGRIRCEGAAVHVGRRTAHSPPATITDLTDLGGRLFAYSTTICPVFPARAYPSTGRPGHLSDRLTCG